MVEIPANRMAVKRFMRMAFSPVRTRATVGGRDMAADREILTKERRGMVSDGQATAFSKYDLASVIARLDRAIQYPRPVVTRCPVKPGDDSTAVDQPSSK